MFLEDGDHSFDAEDGLEDTKVLSEEQKRLYLEFSSLDLCPVDFIFGRLYVGLGIVLKYLVEAFLNFSTLQYFRLVNPMHVLILFGLRIAQSWHGVHKLGVV